MLKICVKILYNENLQEAKRSENKNKECVALLFYVEVIKISITSITLKASCLQ